MMKALRILLTLLGYIFYTLGVVIIMLWLLFPADSALVWLQRKLDAMNPSLTWKIEGLKPALPLSLRLSDISIYAKNDMENKLIQVTDMQFFPDRKNLLQMKKHLPVSYRLHLLGGTVAGDVQFAGEGTDLLCTGKIKDLQLAGLEDIWVKTNRSGSGEMSGDFEFSGSWNNLMQGNLQAALEVNNGSISLQQQILGLEQIDFNTLTTDLTMKSGSLILENGRVESRMLEGSYEGSIRLAQNLYASGISLQGSFEPRPELLGGLKNPAVSSLIRSQLQDGKIAFSVSGTVMEPGILFRGASGIIDGVLEGGGR